MEYKARPTASDDVRWVRGRARFEEGAIVLDPSTLREYSVLEEGEEAHWRLGAVRQPQDAVAFARRFGLLHHGRGTDLREPWTEWESTARHVHSILATAQNLRLAGRGDLEAIAYIREITSTPEWRALWQAGAENDEQRRMQVGVWIAGQVSSGLADTRWGLRTEAEMYGGNRGAADVFLYAPGPRDLMGWINYGLAQTLIEGRPMRRCEGCGVMFLVTDQRQRFHDKQCAQRARYRRSVEKRRQA